MDFGTAKSTKVTYQSQFEEQKAAMMYMGTWYMAGILANKEASKTEVEWELQLFLRRKRRIGHDVWLTNSICCQ